MMWVDIEASLSGIDIKQLTDRELWSYRYLKHVIDRARRRVSGVKTGHFANSRSAINDFASASRERAELSSSITANIDRFSFKIRATTFENIEDDRILRFDGSYAAGTWGNWVLGFGAIDRWWGPGWQSSLVLSNNARPTEGFFMQRKQSEAFSLPGLSLLGPWNIHLFSNQLESRRDIANAKLSGARFTFKPASFVDIGLSRVVQWGGEGRPEGLQTLTDLVLGNDDAEINPGNQMFSFDWRVHLPFIPGVDIAAYHQVFSEDGEGIPGDSAQLWGLEASFLIGSVNTHLSYENHDTRDNSALGTYEHGTYRTGYRSQQRSIGSSLDTASLGQSLLAEHYFSNGHQLYWRYSELTFNAEGMQNDIGGHPYGDNRIEETLMELRYMFPVSKKLQLQTGLQHLSEPLNYFGEVIESHLSLGFEFQW